ncbi:helix-turn-helix domain-containing protein, partial [Guyparkeria halopsychrophila]|uniref:helix-turn-helix domain-containing protein n=1 Tax=Guyparkeria halopsychrophila TaxID=3139421 RepID=UPI0037C6543C
QAVNRRRREAVRLRLDGLTVAQAAERAGVSAPTVTAAFAAFKRGGWPAVDVGRRGRPRKAESQAGPDIGDDMGAAMQAVFRASPGRCWDVEQLAEAIESRIGSRPDARSIRRHLADWGLVPRRGAMPRGKTGPIGKCLVWASTHDAAVLESRLRNVPGEAPMAGGYQLTAQDARGRLWFALYAEPPRAQDYVAFWQTVAERIGAPLAIVTRGIAVQSSALQQALHPHRGRLRVVARPRSTRPIARQEPKRIQDKTRNGNQ